MEKRAVRIFLDIDLVLWLQYNAERLDVTVSVMVSKMVRTFKDLSNEEAMVPTERANKILRSCVPNSGRETSVKKDNRGIAIAVVK